MMFIYKPDKFAPLWATILKIRAIFVHQTLTEHAFWHYLSYNGHFYLWVQRITNAFFWTFTYHFGSFRRPRRVVRATSHLCVKRERLMIITHSSYFKNIMHYYFA